jgi:heme/copper-type cytochrome/quinol oxidase subunit 4
LKLVEFLFGGLLLSVILTEISFWGLLATHNHAYFIALLVCTAVMVYVSYCLYILEPSRQAKVQKEYSFYYILDHQPTDDVFRTQLKNRM